MQVLVRFCGGVMESGDRTINDQQAQVTPVPNLKHA